MFIPILKENFQGRKPPGSCAFAEPELLLCKETYSIDQKVINGHKNPNDSHNYYDENHEQI